MLSTLHKHCGNIFTNLVIYGRLVSVNSTNKGNFRLINPNYCSCFMFFSKAIFRFNSFVNNLPYIDNQCY